VAITKSFYSSLFCFIKTRMSTQAEDKPKTPLTGSHIAPKGHGAGCPCCIPEEDED